MLLVIGRTFSESLKNFVRNGWLSVAAVTVLFLSLFVVSLLFVVTKTADGILKNVQEKANVSVYFKTDVQEEAILKAKSDLAGYSEVKSVEYVTRSQALENFKRNNADEPVIIKSLEELGDNPLLASLVIKANDPAKYEAIANYVKEASFKDDVSRVNYGKNKEIIEKLNRLIGETKRIGLSLAILFAVISILITFNTIRITIYTHKSEIEVMRLVGASNMFIRLPFIFEGIIYAVIALILSTLFVFITLNFIVPQISSVIPKEIISTAFTGNILYLLGIQLIVGAFLGVVSSMIAIRRYLKI
ncbi:MAG TPA: permease-like cell division protein FtsX [Candidatus Moranbacteria bacterium]|nr:permease-like cell division protein FtsX [Candidatus Moranbacteria bacterium]